MLNCTLPCVWHHYKLRSHLLQAHKHASCMYKTPCSRNTYKNTRIAYQHATSMFVCFYPSKQILAILTAKLCTRETQIRHWHSPWIQSQLHYCTCARGLFAPANPKQPQSWSPCVRNRKPLFVHPSPCVWCCRQLRKQWKEKRILPVESFLHTRL